MLTQMPWLSLLVSFVIVFSVAAVGAAFMPGEWYAALNKPTWNPPNWIFGPVWTALYVMIAISGWLLWREPDRTLTMSLFALQLALNGAWSWLFFGRHTISGALLDIVLLLATIVVLIVVAWPINRLAAGLLMPYAAWVAFATVLNAAIWRLNSVSG